MASLTWVLGVRSLPAAVHEDEPAVLVWLTEQEVLTFRHLEGDAPSDGELRESFVEAQHEAGGGAPVRPKKILVESGPLAKRMRALFKGIEVQIGGTASIDTFVAAVTETALEDRREGLALLEAAPAAMREEFMQVAAELDEVSAWDLLPLAPLTVRVPALDLPDGRLGTMGDDDDTFGLLLFFRPEDEATFAQALSLPPEATPRCLVAKLLGLPNEDGTLFEALVPKAFAQGAAEPCTERELALMIAGARALCRFVAAHEDVLLEEPDAPRLLAATYAVEVAGARLEVTLEVHVEPGGPLENGG